MKLIQPTTEERMLMAFALAEATSDKGALGQAIREAPADHPVAQKIRTGADLSAVEWGTLTAAIRHVRAPLLAGLTGQPIEWWEAETSVDELLGMRFIAVPEWLEKWPSQRLSDLCGVRHQAGDTPEFRGWGSPITRPIAIGWDDDFCLVEGYTRCCTLIRDTLAGLWIPTPIPILVGLWKDVTTWTSPKGTRWYGD